jgi:hypothetical protein
MSINEQKPTDDLDDDLEIDDLSGGFGAYKYDDGDDEGDIDLPGSFKPMVFAVSQRRVRDLLGDKANKELDPRPPFQRGYVWDRAKASRLIESVLLNVPLPLVYTAEEKSGLEVVIDGQQRLLTLFGFIEGKFPRDQRLFRLSKLKILKELNGKTFDKLDQDYQRKIQRYNIQIIKISSDSDANVKFEIFERLNSGSVSLNAQELRNCIYRGRFNDLLRELIEYQNFRNAVATDSALDRMKDAELVLRFLAFYDKTYLNYPGGMKSFLNDFMAEKSAITEDRAKSLSEAFKKSCDLAYTVFGTDAFRRFSIGSEKNHSGQWERTVNRALYDIIMWGFTQFDKPIVMKNSDAIRDELIDLTVSDEEFRDAITAATGDKNRVKYRFEAWKSRLEKLLGGYQQGKRLFDPQLRRQLFEAKPVCGVCGQTIHTLDDAQVDHVEPWSVGGATRPENAQLAHRYCNRVKSSKTI